MVGPPGNASRTTLKGFLQRTRTFCSMALHCWGLVIHLYMHSHSLTHSFWSCPPPSSYSYCFKVYFYPHQRHFFIFCSDRVGERVRERERNIDMKGTGCHPHDPTRVRNKLQLRYVPLVDNKPGSLRTVN
uniref:Uncharacterized protein n=1 Tax=Molossus molossus TaxID=27622 RepID=A0A7J8BK21_MOLMO|nr:hypothetical protein HJG59_010445 [Molossus molossus]